MPRKWLTIDTLGALTPAWACSVVYLLPRTLIIETHWLSQNFKRGNIGIIQVSVADPEASTSGVPANRGHWCACAWILMTTPPNERKSFGMRRLLRDMTFVVARFAIGVDTLPFRRARLTERWQLCLPAHIDQRGQLLHARVVWARVHGKDLEGGFQNPKNTLNPQIDRQLVLS